MNVEKPFKAVRHVTVNQSLERVICFLNGMGTSAHRFGS